MKLLIEKFIPHPSTMTAHIDVVLCDLKIKLKGVHLSIDNGKYTLSMPYNYVDKSKKTFTSVIFVDKDLAEDFFSSLEKLIMSERPIIKWTEGIYEVKRKTRPTFANTIHLLTREPEDSDEPNSQAVPKTQGNQKGE